MNWWIKIPVIFLTSVLNSLSVLGGFGSFGGDSYGGTYGNYGGSYAQVDWWGN